MTTAEPKLRKAPPPIGSKVHFWTILSEPFPAGMTNNGRTKWYIKVQCTNCPEATIKEIKYHLLMSGKIKSCGCYNRQAASKRISEMNQVEGGWVGQQMNRWTVIQEKYLKPNTHHEGHYVLCRCICGNTREVTLYNFMSGRSKSCGCLANELFIERSTTHGMSKTVLYQRWAGMLNRCYNENDKAYERYGKRGIVVCEQWHKFENFRDWALSNGFQENLEIDRKDYNGNYDPGNCRFVDEVEQQNNKRNNKLITYNGITQTLAQWVRNPLCKIDYDTVQERLAAGWEFETAITKPKRIKGIRAKDKGQTKFSSQHCPATD